MTKMRLTAFPIIIIAFIITLASCRRDDIEHQNQYMKTNIVMSGAQEVPANPSSAIGSMDVSYSRLSRVLSYTVRWQNLTDSLSLMHIHGMAPVGFNASPVQNIVAPGATGTATIFPQKTGTRFTYTKNGTITATLFIDGVAIKEADLLNAMYYVNIHTTAYSGGEIRGQIKFE